MRIYHKHLQFITVFTYIMIIIEVKKQSCQFLTPTYLINIC